MNPLLINFLYTLARDHLPTGCIERLIAEAEAIAKLEVVYSSEHLRNLAQEWEGRLVQSENLASTSSSSKSSAASASRTHLENRASTLGP